MKASTLANLGIFALAAYVAYKLTNAGAGLAKGAANIRDKAIEDALDVFGPKPNMDPGANYPISDGRTRKSWPTEKVLPMGWHPDGAFAEQHFDVATNVFHASPIGGRGIVH